MSRTHTILCCFVLVAIACGGERKRERVERDLCAGVPEGWRYERIEFPPEFAPTLPKGVEHLYFAPGMFEPESKTYWTYAFLIDLDKPLADQDALYTFLLAYYEGLVAAVSKSTNKGSTKVALRLEPPKDGLGRGSLQLDDVFATGKPLDLVLVVSQVDRRLAVGVSPKGVDNWTELDAYRECLLSRGPLKATGTPSAKQ